MNRLRTRLFVRALESRVTPVTLTVLNTADSGPGSLRQAVIDSNNLAGTDTIVFDAAAFATPQTIALTTGALDFTASVIITGPGSDLATISGEGQSQIFAVFNPVNINVSKLTFARGVPAVDVFSPTAIATFTGCTFTNNAGGAGGAINFYGVQLTLRNCTLSGNLSGQGGAVYFRGTNLTLDSSTLSGNSASNGGGLFIYRFLAGSTNITNCTIANNTAFADGGGIFLTGGTAATIAVNNSTITGNQALGKGGGIARNPYGAAQSFLLQSTILSGNLAGLGPDAFTSTLTGNYNAVGSSAGITSFTNSNGSVGAALKLSALTSRGGPTMTIAPLPGSAAIDQGRNVSGLATDQRGTGFPRVIDDPGTPNKVDGADVGEYEVDPAIPIAAGPFAGVIAAGATTQNLTVNYYTYGAATIDTATLDDSDVRITGPGGFNVPGKFASFMAIPSGVAAVYSFTPPGGDWDLADNGVYAVAIQAGQVLDTAVKAVPAGTAGTFSVLVPETFVVTNANDTGAGSLRQAIVDANATPAADFVTFDPGFFSSAKTITLTGGGISITQSVTIDNGALGPNVVAVSGNKAFNVFIISGSTTAAMAISGLSIIECGSFSPAVIVSGTTTTFTDCVFTKNSFPINCAGTMTLDRCTITGNSAGGVRSSPGAVVTLRNSAVTGNTLAGDGAAIFVDGGTVTVENSVLSGNSATGGSASGGAISISGLNAAAVKLSNCTIANNTAGAFGAGGGIHVAGGANQTLEITNCTITGNTFGGPSGRGGGIARTAAGPHTVTVNSSIVSGNFAATGPDVFTGGEVIANYSAFGTTAGITTFTSTKCIVGADLKMTPLALHGGQSPTIALAPVSAALDQGKNFIGLTTDQRGAGFARTVNDSAIVNAADGTDIGAFESELVNPLAVGQFPDVTMAGAAIHLVTVNYYAFSPNAIDTATLGDTDVRITGPGGFDAPAKFTGFTAIPGGVAATYSFATPGGTWDPADFGTYTVSVGAGEVLDTPGGKAVYAGPAGAFVVAIPQTLTVTNANDAGPGSLRQAVLDANAVTGAVDVITFDPAFFSSAKTIALTSGQIAITDSVNIDNGKLGAGVVTVSGNNASRIFNVDGPGVISVSLSGLTLANGRAVGANGGAVQITDEFVSAADCVFTGNSTTVGGGAVGAGNFGGFMADRCTFSKNTATNTGGAISSFGVQVTLRDCSLTGNSGSGGGAVFASSPAGGGLTVQRCTLTGNTGSDGGAIYSQGGAFTIENSTLSGNRTALSGGAISIGYSSIGPTRLTNCTIANNTSAGNGGGIAVLSGQAQTIVIANSTITGNKSLSGKGGGISGPPYTTTVVFQLDGTILSGNSATSGPDAFVNGQVRANFSAVGSVSGISAFFNTSSSVGAALKLSGLGVRGGSIATVALLPGSAAIDQGKNTYALTNDQRGVGFPRLFDDPAIANKSEGTDVGAYEVDPNTPVADGPFADVTVAGATSHALTVNYYAYGAATIDTATLDDSDIRVTGPGGFDVSAKLVSFMAITGGVAAVYSFTPPGGNWDAADNGSFDVAVAAGQILDTGGKSVFGGTAGGFAVLVPATFVVTNANDAGPGSLRQAVADANANSIADFVTFDPAFFTSAKTITLTSGELLVSESVTIDAGLLGPSVVTVSGNKASRVFNVSSAFGTISVNLTGLTIANGKSTSPGGGLRNVGETMTITNCVFSGNTSPSGGAAYLNGNTTMDRCTFVGNSVAATVPVDGGAIFIAGSPTIVLRNSSLTGNTATDDGGAIFLISGKLTLENCTLAGNSATGTTSDGGAISLQGGSNMAFKATNCTIVNNTAAGTSGFGGGIHVGNGLAQTYLISNCTITGNKVTGATAKGGGLGRSTTVGTFQVDSSILSGNSAPTGPDAFTTGQVTARYSAFGSSAGVTTFTNTKSSIGAALNLGSLGFHGGPVMTILPLAGSAALDQGRNFLGLPTDARGAGFPRLIDDPALANTGDGTDVGAVEIDLFVPQAEGSFADVTAGGATVHGLIVSYSAYGANSIDTATLDDADIRVTGPGGFNVLATFVGFVPVGGSVKAGYQFIPPGGDWSTADNGVYTVSLEANQVFNTPGGKSAPAGTLGSFAVAVPLTLVVTNPNDAGPGSLRQAVLDANALPNTADLITFDPGVFGTAQTIMLTGGELAIVDSVKIAGPGAGLLTVDAGGKSRHFNITGAGVLNVTMSGMTLTGGATTATGVDGGSVLIDDETVSLSAMTFTKNSTVNGDGGAISVAGLGKLSVLDCTITANTVGGTGLTDLGGNGAGINFDAAGSLTVLRSFISGNTASEDGGGIYFFYDGSLTVSDTTISGNISNAKFGQVGGGGIYFWGKAATSVVTITNSTISGNKCVMSGRGGGLVLPIFAGKALIQNCTITGNDSKTSPGGGIYSSSGPGTVTLQSTIVAGNTVNGAANLGSDLAFSVSTNVAGNNNLIGIQNPATTKLTGTGNKTGTLAAPLDAKLGPLANNGGPTLTHALLPGSPAINTGNNALGLGNDQRGAGFGRVVGTAADIGAFEVQVLPPCVVGKAVVINGGDAQRSRVTSVRVDFDSIVTLPANPADAFQLSRQSDGALVALTAAVTTDTATHVTLTFAGALSEFGSLADGRFTLEIFAAKVSGASGLLDGDCNGIGGDNFVLVGDPATNKLFRLFGDSDGDGDTDGFDFLAFAPAFANSSASPVFDFNANGVVDALDFFQFRDRFGTGI